MSKEGRSEAKGGEGRGFMLTIAEKHTDSIAFELGSISKIFLSR